MSTRIHIVVEPAEKERFRARARQEGLTLSEWLRDVARQALVRGEGGTEIRTVDELREFFKRCDEREKGTEPDWAAHRREIEESMRDGIPDA
jgi:hypothetical protein